MRWPVLPLLVLVSLALVSPAATATSPAVPDESPPAPTPLGVPWPHVGDAGSYTRSVVRVTDAADDGLRIVEAAAILESFLVEPWGEQYDAQGKAHQVVAFRTWAPALAMDARYLLDAQDGTQVALTLFRELDRGYSNYTYLTDLPDGFPDLSPLCGLRNGLQGVASTAEAVVVFPEGRCKGAMSTREGGSTFVRVREDPWGDGTAVGFQQAGTGQVVLAWFTSEVPYPVRLVEELRDGTYAVMDLTHFQRGGAAAPRGAGTLPSLPPLELAPHGGIGADESGVDHPFPWREAWAAAQEHEAVADFLTDHPRAVVQRSGYNFEERHGPTGLAGEQREDTRADAWYFHLDDGDEAEKFVVRHVVGERSYVLPVVGGVGTEVVDEIEVEALGSQTAEPAAVVAPPEVPTVASALAWWQAFATPRFQEAGPNGWMTWLSGGCCDGLASVAAGRLAGSVTVDGTASVSWEASFLHTTWDGKASVLLENVVESDYGLASLPVRVLGKAIGTPLQTILDEARERLPSLKQGALIAPVGSDGPWEDGGSGSRLSAKDAASSPENRLTGGVAGATAAAAAGVAGLAWLVKLLLAPLFSRVRKEGALEQPVRASLLDLVEAEPGIHLKELVRRSGKGTGTVRHHLAKLEDVGLVKSRLGGGFLCYFPAQAGAAAMAAAGVTKSDGARRVVEAARGGGTAAELARRTGLAPGTVDYHLARLASAGIVRRDGTRWLA